MSKADKIKRWLKKYNETTNPLLKEFYLKLIREAKNTPH